MQEGPITVHAVPVVLCPGGVDADLPQFVGKTLEAPHGPTPALLPNLLRAQPTLARLLQQHLGMAFKGGGKPYPPVAGVSQSFENDFEAYRITLKHDSSVRREGVLLFLDAPGDIVPQPDLMPVLRVPRVGGF